MALKTVYQNKGETLAQIKLKGESTRFVPRNDFFTTDKDVEYSSEGLVVYSQEKPTPKKKKKTKKTESKTKDTVSLDINDDTDSEPKDEFETNTDKV